MSENPQDPRDEAEGREGVSGPDESGAAGQGHGGGAEGPPATPATTRARAGRSGVTPTDEELARAKERFLVSFRAKGIVKVACEAAGFHRASAYRYKAQDEDFSAAWDTAREEAADELEREAVRRATEGTQRPVFYRGEIVGHVTEYSDRLLELLLRATRPEKYRERYEVRHTDDDSIDREVQEVAKALGLQTGDKAPGHPEKMVGDAPLTP